MSENGGFLSEEQLNSINLKYRSQIIEKVTPLIMKETDIC